MSIDRIGKGGASAPPTAPSAPKAAETGKPFEVSRPAAAEGASRVDATAASALEQLKAGKIDFDQYVSAKVEQATAHLQGMPKVELDAIRSMLRDQMATDPTLVDLVKRATGRAPEPPEE